MNQTNKSKIRCDNCGELNDDKSIYCKKCHAMLFRNIKCEKCGAENSAKNIYCNKCNHQLQPDPNIEKAKENNKNNFKIGIIVSSCLLVIITIFITVNFLTSNSNDKIASTVASTNSIFQETKSNFEIDEGIEIQKYYNKNLPYLEYVTPTKNGEDYFLTCKLDKSCEDYISSYYPFAESCISITEDAIEKFDIRKVHLTVIFFDDDNRYISWITDDLGKTGTFKDIMTSANYSNIKSYSLNDLKNYYNK